MDWNKIAQEIKEDKKKSALVDARKAPPWISLSESQAGCRPFTLVHETQWKLFSVLLTIIVDSLIGILCVCVNYLLTFVGKGCK